MGKWLLGKIHLGSLTVTQPVGKNRAEHSEGNHFLGGGSGGRGEEEEKEQEVRGESSEGGIPFCVDV